MVSALLLPLVVLLGSWAWAASIATMALLKGSWDSVAIMYVCMYVECMRLWDWTALMYCMERGGRLDIYDFGGVVWLVGVQFFKGDSTWSTA